MSSPGSYLLLSSSQSPEPQTLDRLDASARLQLTGAVTVTDVIAAITYASAQCSKRQREILPLMRVVNEPWFASNVLYYPSGEDAVRIGPDNSACASAVERVPENVPAAVRAKPRYVLLVPLLEDSWSAGFTISQKKKSYSG